MERITREALEERIISNTASTSEELLVAAVASTARASCSPRTIIVRERSGIRLGNLYPCASVSTGLGPTEFATTRTWV
jgi:hypothetical protein